ncbi:C-C motif chemokine 27-like [Rhinatrema bivittatum]|uniref:C-C motif chemokine 27-like n=1 Tax=Rhinatrema bivittatum TaxID=194408 RepID=UPI00112BA826|nr:C-C motif chemokine 27-like [Rhinatrema bivittatum]
MLAEPQLGGGVMRLPVLLTCFALSALPALAGAPKVGQTCCTEVARAVPRRMFTRVKKVTFQLNDGVCKVEAAVLTLKNKKLCIDPKNKDLMKWLQRRGITQRFKTSWTPP